MGEGQQQRILHLDNMTAGFFRFDAGTSTDPDHQHPNEQVSFVIRGKVRFHLGDEIEELNAGSGARIPSGIPHYIEVLEDALIMDCFSPKRQDMDETG
jgi:quercetin dioxygenase-like cupin family protein